MADKVDLTFVDENDFEKRGKWFFWSDNSSWEIGSTISVDTNDSLADITKNASQKRIARVTVHGTTTAVLANSSRMTTTPRKPQHLLATEKEKEILRKPKQK